MKRNWESPLRNSNFPSGLKLFVRLPLHTAWNSLRDGEFIREHPTNFNRWKMFMEFVHVRIRLMKVHTSKPQSSVFNNCPQAPRSSVSNGLFKLTHDHSNLLSIQTHSMLGTQLPSWSYYPSSCRQVALRLHKNISDQLCQPKQPQAVWRLHFTTNRSQNRLQAHSKSPCQRDNRKNHKTNVKSPFRNFPFVAFLLSTFVLSFSFSYFLVYISSSAGKFFSLSSNENSSKDCERRRISWLRCSASFFVAAFLIKHFSRLILKDKKKTKNIFFSFCSFPEFSFAFFFYFLSFCLDFVYKKNLLMKTFSGLKFFMLLSCVFFFSIIAMRFGLGDGRSPGGTSTRLSA